MKSFLSNFLEPFSYFIYTVVLCIVVSRTKTARIKVLFCYYLVATLMISYASMLAWYKTLGDNNWIYNLFFVITMAVFSWYFYNTFYTRQKRSIVLFIFGLNVILFIIIHVIFHHFFQLVHNYITAFYFSGIVVYCLLYFDQVISNVNEQNILYEFDFWLVAGYLLYFLSCFFIILYYNNAVVQLRQEMWAVQNAILFLSSVITLAGNLWIQYRRKLL